jgi:hypothetical protein
MIRLPFHHPAHTFERINLPPVPAASGGVRFAYQCPRCKLMGVSDGLTSIYVRAGASDYDKVVHCSGGPMQAGITKRAMITSEALCKRGDAFAHLLPNTTHPFVDPPCMDCESLAGVWVAGPSGPVKLSGGEFMPMPFRVRTRTRHVEAA